ncbi:unnamed protein product, partial [Natator depressus]
MALAHPGQSFGLQSPVPVEEPHRVWPHPAGAAAAGVLSPAGGVGPAGCSLCQIREEDRSPPPSSPPPLFSVIPGGFIKQLVRETEKESKVAKRKEKGTLNSKED